MSNEQRKNVRFDDISRIEAPDLCIFPGLLVDISRAGCKVRFPAAISVDMDTDYEFTIKTARKSGVHQFTLIGHPQWKQSVGEATEIGFKILHSPGMKQFEQYVQHLAAEEEDAVADERMLERAWLSV